MEGAGQGRTSLGLAETSSAHFRGQGAQGEHHTTGMAPLRLGVLSLPGPESSGGIGCAGVRSGPPGVVSPIRAGNSSKAAAGPEPRGANTTAACSWEGEGPVWSVGRCWLDEGPGMCHVGTGWVGGVRGETM